MRDTAAESPPNGAVFSGRTTTAFSRAPAGCLPRMPVWGSGRDSRDVWLRVEAQAGQISYASLTYGTIDQDALAVLPPC
jgi:hypothetical protein